jgi:hypothetical protein
MKRSGLDRLGPALVQAIQMALGGGEFGIAEGGILGKQLARFVDVAGQEDPERHPQRIR